MIAKSGDGDDDAADDDDDDEVCVCVCVCVCAFVQAFIIGWTSDLVPKILYTFETGNTNLEGYTNFSLSVYNTSEYPIDMKPDSQLFDDSYPYCRYNVRTTKFTKK